MSKKWVLGLSAAVVATSMLSACGSNDDNNSGSSASPSGAPAATATAKPAEPVTLNFHTYGTEQNYNWAATLAAFEKKYPDIKVNLIPLSEKGDTQEASKKLDLAAASGEQMDILMFSDPAGYAQRVGLGMVEPLDAYIQKEGLKYNEEYKVDTQMNGKYYALPGKFNPWYVLLNKTHLTEAGLDVPKDWTWDQFMEYAQKLTKTENGKTRYGTYFHGPQNGGWLEYMKLALVNQENDPEFLKADGSSNLDSPLFRKSVELRVKMEKEDKSATPYAEMLSQKLHYRAQFFNQSASMIVIGSWMNTELGGTEQFPLNFEVAVAPIPKNSASDPAGFTPVTTDYMAMAAKSKNKDAVYTFLRWYTTEGQIVQAKNIPSWSKVSTDDLNKLIDTILSGTKTPDKVDKASLVSTLAGSKSSKIVAPVTYQAEIYKAINEEFELLILGKQDVDTMVKKSQERTQKLIDANKK